MTVPFIKSLFSQKKVHFLLARVYSLSKKKSCLIVLFYAEFFRIILKTFGNFS